MGRWIALGLVLAGVLGLVARVYLFRPSDDQQILNALENSIKASKDGRPGGVFDILTRSATFNDMPIDNRQEVARFIRELEPDLKVWSPNPVIDGDSAVIVSDVTVDFGLPMVPDQRIQDVRIHFERVAGVQWGIFPVQEWKVTKVEAPTFVPPPVPNF